MSIRLLKKRAVLCAMSVALFCSANLLSRSSTYAQDLSDEMTVDMPEGDSNGMSSETEEVMPEESVMPSDAGSVESSEDMPSEPVGDSEQVEDEQIEVDSLTEPAMDESVSEADNTLFQTLREYLEASNFEEADRETFRVLQVLVGEQSADKGFFVMTEWDAFVKDEASCANVQRIDELWQEASSGTLGFSQQKRLFDAIRDPLAFYRAIGWIERNTFETKVEWKRIPLATSPDQAVDYIDDKEPNFQDPVPGHLPAAMYWESESGDVQQDRRLALFAKCGL